MKNRVRCFSALALVLVLLVAFCGCDAETKDPVGLTRNTDQNFQPEANAELIFSAQLRGGWTPWVYILLYDNARIEVYASNDGAATLDMCLKKAADYLIFSEILEEDDYQKAQQLLAQLPELREEPVVNDAWTVNATYDGAAYEFLLYPVDGEERNPEWTGLIHYLISVSVKDLEAVEELVPWKPF